VKHLALGFLVLGALLLALILQQTDLPQVWDALREVGWLGVLVLLGLHFVAFALDTTTWYLTIPSARPDPKWIRQLWKSMMVGEAFNVVTPLASLGGEPIKAALIRKHCGIGYREGTASLILAQTIVNLALVLILLVGFLLMLTTAALPSSYRFAAGVGMALFSLGILGFFLVQRTKLISRVGGWLGRGEFGERARRALQLVHEVEDRIIAFYTDTPRRLALAVGTSILHWIAIIASVYVALRLLGQSVTLTEAWVLTALVVLVRSALFVVPAGLGSQDGTFVLVAGALTGSPAIGLALALLARFREVVWVVWGLAIGWQLEALRGSEQGAFSGPIETDQSG
jgi:uncharacterized protein (TIRG00374 family)